MAEFNVKFLIAGNGINSEKCDILHIGSSVSDFGKLIVAPRWLRLLVTGVKGNSQLNAEKNISDKWVSNFKDQYNYSKVLGAEAGKQRFRIEPKVFSVIPGSFSTEMETALISKLKCTAATKEVGTLEVDADLNMPIDEIWTAIAGIRTRSFQLPTSLIDAELVKSTSGEPWEFTMTLTDFESQITNKAE